MFAVLGLGDSNLLMDRQTTTAKDCNQCAQQVRCHDRIQEIYYNNPMFPEP